jgi:hypothetical protein
MSQWLDYVRYGNGHDGSPAVSGTINSYAAVTGTAGSTTVTTNLSVSVGDLVLLHQTQHASNAGKWELVYVVATGSGSFTAGQALTNTYATAAQAVLVPQYTGGEISGAVTGSAWNGSVGGFIVLFSNGNLTISGSITAPAGFRGAQQNTTADNGGYQGEGNLGAGDTRSTATNGNGAGGGGFKHSLDWASGGGGGGNGTAGTNGGDGQQYGGVGGLEVGSATLATFFLGGGGSSGSMGRNSSTVAGAGGNGSGGVIIVAKNITITGSIALSGVAGVSKAYDTNSGGGGGAGGSCLIKCETAVLGTNKIIASGGAGGAGGVSEGRNNGGAGGAGRIRCDYYSSVSGTTTPTLSSAQDTNLKSQVYGGIL